MSGKLVLCISSKVDEYKLNEKKKMKEKVEGGTAEK